MAIDQPRKADHSRSEIPMSFLRQSDNSRNFSTNLPETFGYNGTINAEGQARPNELENGNHLATDEENQDTLRYEHELEGYRQN